MKTGQYAELQKMIDRILKNNLKVEYIHGYLTAVLCSSDMIVPSEWLPLLMGKDGKDIVFDSMKEAQNFTGRLMELYNEIAKSIMDGSFAPLYTIKPKKVNPGIAKTWCKGFFQGIALWEDSFIDDKTAREYLIPIILLANPDTMKDVFEEQKEFQFTDENITELKNKYLDDIPGNVVALRRYYQPDIVKKTSSVKIGRNDPCPCGSGKKYKKCCGVN